MVAQSSERDDQKDREAAPTSDRRSPRDSNDRRMDPDDPGTTAPPRNRTPRTPPADDDAPSAGQRAQPNRWLIVGLALSLPLGLSLLNRDNS